MTADTDGDGVLDNVGNCPHIANHDQRDTDGEGKGDACDPVDNRILDDDGDGVANGRIVVDFGDYPFGGYYILRETTVPAGYAAPADQWFWIDDIGLVVQVVTPVATP